MMNVLKIVIVNDGLGECLYLDGKAWDKKTEVIVYSSDIAEVAGDQPVFIKSVQVKEVDEWPDSLTDLVRLDGKSWEEVQDA